MELSQASEPIYDNTKRFGKEEMEYLQWIAPSLQNPPMPSPVKMWLEKAQAEGLDPQRIYEAAVNARLPHWMKAPSFSDVNPNH